MLIAIFISAEFHVKRCWIQGWLERVDLYENEIVSGENALLVCHLSKGVMENATVIVQTFMGTWNWKPCEVCNRKHAVWL